jgi:HK97 family phage major capsid protein
MNLKPYYDAVVAAEAKVHSLATQINAHFEANENEKALEMRPQLDKAKADAKAANDLYLSMRNAVGDGTDPARNFTPMGGDPEPKEITDLRSSKEYSNQFWNAFKTGATPNSIQAGMHSAEKYARLLDALTETGGSPAGSEGGFLNPVDFDGKIIERMRQFVDLAESCFNQETVTAYSGWRAIETATALQPLQAMTENTDQTEIENPTFVKLPYTVSDRGGFLPIGNDLLSDSPAQIMTYVSKWFGKKVVLTRNYYVLNLINALSPTVVAAAKDLAAAIKTALNITLDPDISAGACICTNQSGYNALDQLLDGTGRPLLQPDPTNATRMLFKGRRVVVLANRLWPNLTTPTRARIFIGGPEYLTLFQRAAFEMATTVVGGDAWRKNNTEVRGIMRLDCKEIDAEAGTLLTVPVEA